MRCRYSDLDFLLNKLNSLWENAFANEHREICVLLGMETRKNCFFSATLFYR